MIYLVEDESNIRELVIYTLQNTGFSATGFSSSEEFWPALSKKMPELVLLDIMLPGEDDGLTILKKLRSDPKTEHLPVIMLTAKSTEYDKVLGLDCGADDYLTKPFGMMELVARIKRLLHRITPTKTSETYLCANLSMNLPQHHVEVDGEEVTLTLKEFELLAYLFKNQGIALTRDQILSAVWGYEFNGETRTVDVHIRSLRGKLLSAADLIETVRGVGYRIGGNS
ncbi:response regulator transcription factor [Scatolibacter rhodanostii]|uniref:response regulator transcription factor n=1 Tax=Scatolibacter rhodanostii TaxID=2014781 RepID=UPI000C070E9D|nr:response regulator transcription factor [Scatolibacter rhodanostii]